MDDRWFRLGDHGRYSPQMKYTSSTLFFTIGVAAIAIGLRAQHQIRNATVHITSETTSHRWSFKQSDLARRPVWSDKTGDPPLSVANARKICLEVSELLRESSDQNEISDWTYGSIRPCRTKVKLFAY